MTIVIHLASGTQGAPVLTALHPESLSPVAAVRDPSAYSGRGEATSADLFSVDSLVAAYSGADAIFVHLPVGPGDVQQQHAEVIVEAIGRALPMRVVVSASGYPLAGDPAGRSHRQRGQRQSLLALQPRSVADWLRDVSA